MEKRWLQKSLKNAKLKFLYRQSRYLTTAYRRLLCNALIEPHFDYGCSSWFPLLKTNLKLKLQKAQNKSICFWLNLPPRSHIDPSHFRKINWLPVSDRLEYYIGNTAVKYWNGIVPGHNHEMFKPSLCTRSQMALDIPPRKTNTGQKSLSFLGPKIWSKIDPSIKNVRTSSSFMHVLRKIFFSICKANSSYYDILIIDIVIWFSHTNIISSCHHWYPFKSFAIFQILG